MSTRINFKQGFLFSNVEINPNDYADEYESAEECFEDFKNEIIQDCLAQGYNDFEIKAVLNYFDAKICNANCEWNGNN